MKSQITFFVLTLLTFSAGLSFALDPSSSDLNGKLNRWAGSNELIHTPVAFYLNQAKHNSDEDFASYLAQAKTKLSEGADPNGMAFDKESIQKYQTDNPSYGGLYLDVRKDNLHFFATSYILNEQANLDRDRYPYMKTQFLSWARQEREGASAWIARRNEIVKLLLQSGANPDSKVGADGESILIEQCTQLGERYIYSDLSLISLMLTYKANPDIKNKQGQTCMEIIRTKSIHLQSAIINIFQHYQDLSVNKDFVYVPEVDQQLLERQIENGLDINAIDMYGKSPLEETSLNLNENSIRVMKLLLESGAVPTIEGLSKAVSEADFIELARASQPSYINFRVQNRCGEKIIRNFIYLQTPDQNVALRAKKSGGGYINLHSQFRHYDSSFNDIASCNEKYEMLKSQLDKQRVLKTRLQIVAWTKMFHSAHFSFKEI